MLRSRAMARGARVWGEQQGLLTVLCQAVVCRRDRAREQAWNWNHKEMEIKRERSQFPTRRTLEWVRNRKPKKNPPMVAYSPSKLSHARLPHHQNTTKSKKSEPQNRGRVPRFRPREW
jgi:hypothetical protein